MRFFSGVFPYTNLNSLNLDWLVDKVKELSGAVDGVEEATEAAQAAADAAQAAADTAIEAVEALPDFTQLTNDVATLKTAVNREILHYDNVAVTAATNAQIMRIPATGTDGHITANTVVVEIGFDNPDAIASKIEAVSYAGYIVFSGTANSATIASVTLANKNN